MDDFLPKKDKYGQKLRFSLDLVFLDPKNVRFWSFGRFLCLKCTINLVDVRKMNFAF